MSENRFTVGSYYRPGWPGIGVMGEALPLLQLSGGLLEQAGFRIGSRVWVSIAEPGQLVVTLVDEAGGAGHGTRTR